jgi:nicotinamide-nucleotide amidase
MAAPEEEIGRLLREKKLTLGTVESATGGLIAARIINVAGSSDYFRGGIVAYSNEVKMRCVGVRKETLDEQGAVSAPVAEQMAAGGRRVLRVDVCLSDTGIAGPGGATSGKPVGLFYLGLADQDGASARRHVFSGTREENRQQAVDAALAWLTTYLEGLP